VHYRSAMQSLEQRTRIADVDGARWSGGMKMPMSGHAVLSLVLMLDMQVGMYLA